MFCCGLTRLNDPVSPLPFTIKEFKKNTGVNSKCFLAAFENEFGYYDVSEIFSDDIMSFLVTVTEGHKSSTKKLKYSLMG